MSSLPLSPLRKPRNTWAAWAKAPPLTPKNRPALLRLDLGHSSCLPRMVQSPGRNARPSTAASWPFLMTQPSHGPAHSGLPHLCWLPLAPMPPHTRTITFRLSLKVRLLHKDFSG